MNYPTLLDTILTHIATIDDEIGKRNTDKMQTAVDELYHLITDEQHKQWIESILALQ